MLCPGLRELTLCAYLLSGTWKWPETSHNYAAAFSNFRQLRRLALNHDDLAVELNDFGEMESFGKFSTACSEEGTDLRHAFCRSLAQSCSSLTEIAFCPIEQDQSRLLIERKGEILAEVRFTDNGGHFFWRPS